MSFSGFLVTLVTFTPSAIRQLPPERKGSCGGHLPVFLHSVPNSKYLNWFLGNATGYIQGQREAESAQVFLPLSLPACSVWFSAFPPSPCLSWSTKPENYRKCLQAGSPQDSQFREKGKKRQDARALVSRAEEAQPQRPGACLRTQLRLTAAVWFCHGSLHLSESQWKTE